MAVETASVRGGAFSFFVKSFMFIILLKGLLKRKCYFCKIILEKICHFSECLSLIFHKISIREPESPGSLSRDQAGCQFPPLSPPVSLLHGTRKQEAHGAPWLSGCIKSWFYPNGNMTLLWKRDKSLIYVLFKVVLHSRIMFFLKTKSMKTLSCTVEFYSSDSSKNFLQLCSKQRSQPWLDMCFMFC